MPNPDFDNLAIKSREMAYGGKEYEEIIKALPINQLTISDQKAMRSLINDFIVQYNLRAQVKNKYRTQIMLGLVAFILGIFIILFARAKGESALGFGLAIGLIGLYIVKKGYTKYKEPLHYQHISPEKESKFHRY